MKIKKCTLCGNTETVTVKSFPMEKIWEQLAVNHGLRCPSELVDKLSPAKRTMLLQCKICGLQYFSPAIQGNAEFYNRLTSDDSSYYNQETWDFKRALKYIEIDSNILDVGCGSGAFLKYAKDSGFRPLGIDSNADAINKAHAIGLPAECMHLKDFGDLNKGRFDVVTAFQIVEHLDDVPTFISEAVACLRSGGRLLISVPNRKRFWRRRLEPLDCPPHHMSRWSKKQLEYIALKHKMKILSIDIEPTSLLDVAKSLFRHTKVPGRSYLANVGGWPNESWPALRAALKTIDKPSWLLTRLGLRYQSILAVLENS